MHKNVYIYIYMQKREMHLIFLCTYHRKNKHALDFLGTYHRKNKHAVLNLYIQARKFDMHAIKTHVIE